MLLAARTDPSALDALLDAVVNVGRSVTFVLQSEMLQPGPAMGGWHEADQARMRRPANSLLPWLHKARTLSTHQEPLGIGHGPEAKIRDPTMLSLGEEYSLSPPLIPMRTALARVSEQNYGSKVCSVRDTDCGSLTHLVPVLVGLPSVLSG